MAVIPMPDDAFARRHRAIGRQQLLAQIDLEKHREAQEARASQKESLRLASEFGIPEPSPNIRKWEAQGHRFPELQKCDEADCRVATRNLSGYCGDHNRRPKLTLVVLDEAA